MKLLLLLMLCSAAHAGTATLKWNACKLMNDGSAIVGPVTYDIYKGQHNAADKPLLFAGVKGLKRVVYGLKVGVPVCFNVRCVDGMGRQSAPSNEGCKWLKVPNSSELNVE